MWEAISIWAMRDVGRRADVVPDLLACGVRLETLDVLQLQQIGQHALVSNRTGGQEGASQSASPTGRKLLVRVVLWLGIDCVALISCAQRWVANTVAGGGGCCRCATFAHLRAVIITQALRQHSTISQSCDNYFCLGS